MNNYSSDSINKQEFDLFKCEVCDDHLKRRFFELKEMFYKIYKNYIKIFKLVKNKDEISLKKIIEEIGITQKDYIKYRNLVEKLIYIRKISNNSDCNKHIFYQGDDREKIELNEELKKRKELLKTFRKNINELEEISNHLLNKIESISLTSSLINISTIN